MNENGKPSIKQNGRTQAYEIIHGMIIHGELPAGTVTSVAELIEKLGLGRSPIRDAILRLNDEGLVQVIARKGIFITGIRSKDIKEIFQLRLAIEFLALDNIINTGDEEGLKKLEEIVNKQDQLIRSGNEEAFPTLDEDFHFHIINTLNNRRINQILEESRRQMALYGYNAITAHKNARESALEHRRILENIAQKDPTAAKREMERHLIKAQNSVLLG